MSVRIAALGKFAWAASKTDGGNVYGWVIKLALD